MEALEDELKKFRKTIEARDDEIKVNSYLFLTIFLIFQGFIH
jgi:hypothetical protein